MRRSLNCCQGLVLCVVAVWGCGVGCLLNRQTPKPQPVEPAAPNPEVTRTGEVYSGQPIRFHTLPYDALQQHTFSKVGEDADPEISPDGKLLAFASSRHNPTFDIYIKSVEGTTITQVTTDAAHDMQPAFSPDARTLTYASNRNGNWDIFAVDLTTRKSLQLTNSKQHDVHPSWSPDGRYIVYSSQSGRTGEWELWIVSVDNPGQRKLIGPGLFPCWHPQRERIVFQRASRRSRRWYSIWTLEWVDEEAKYPTEIVADRQWAAVGPAWSPDGRRLAFATVSKGQAGPDHPDRYHGDQICIIDGDGSGLIQLTSGRGNHWSPCWGKDGRIYFVSDSNGHTNIWSVLPISSVLGH